jgi:sigma-B regulation protein RsbU (phosphoserine phosphatase)
MNAALLMAKTASLYRCLGKTEHSPGRLLGRLNEEICETATRGMFVTMVGGIYDPASGLVRLANAGHEPPLHYVAGTGFRALPADAPPLGITPMADGSDGVPEIELWLDGGSLYVFTDGVTEGFVEDGSALGVDGMKELIEENIALPAAERLQAVVGRVHRGGEALHDDLTILVIDDAEPAQRRAAGAGAETLLDFTFPSQAGRLKEVRAKVRETARLCGFADDVVNDIVLPVDEACQNIIRHAYGGSGEGEIVIEICRAGGDFVVLLRDFAEPTDVATVKPRDLGDVRPGGLGTHFMAEVMDRVEFLIPPEGGGNLLRLVKLIA